MSAADGMMLWTDAYLADTGHLTTAQHGAYLLILMAMWRNGGSLPNEEKRLARTARMTVGAWRKIAPEVLNLLTVEGDSITQKRLQKERVSALTKIEKKKQAGALGGKAKALNNKDVNLADATGLPEQISSDAPETKTKTKTRKERSSEDKSSGADAPRDIRKDLFDRGRLALERMTGKTPDSCRSLIGKWLKAVDDEAIHVLGAIEDAERNRVADPVAWINQTLKPRTRAQGPPARQAQPSFHEIAAEIRSNINGQNQNGPASSPEPLDGELFPPLRSVV